MLKSRNAFFACLLFAVCLASSAFAQTICYIDDCDNGKRCYNFNGKKWCEVTYSGSNHWSKVNVYNHTGYSAVSDSWNQLNNPPNGPGNTLWMVTDGVNNSTHDIDYWWGYYGTTGWWGITYTTAGSNGCIQRSSGQIKINRTYTDGKSYTALLTLAEHESGHGVGLAHVCSCANVMDPCMNCNSSALTYCDGQGLQQLYP